MASRISVTVDAVVFSVNNGVLQLLLIQRGRSPFKGHYALPGGFVEVHEELDNAVKRELEEETNVKNIFVKQLGAYGAVKRDPRGRVVSVAYLALIRADQKLKASDDAAVAKWFPVEKLPTLAFDHKQIVSDALRQLRYEIQTTNIAFQILPKKFTMKEMQGLYECVLGKPLDKRNFRKKIQEQGMIKKLKETRMDGAHRPARLYSYLKGG